MKKKAILTTIIFTGVAASGYAASPAPYEDGRPQASLRLDATDQGVVLRHGSGPNQCDSLGARDIWVWQADGTYYLHYDGAGPKGWLACLATSQDLEHWKARGPALDFGASDRNDSAAASYLMFFSASTESPIFRTISLARTRDLNGPWTLAAEPLLPPTEQIENSSLYFEKENNTWFLFTNHVGFKAGMEYTDAIWVYWSKDLTKWDPAHKAVVLDSANCKWSKHIIGLPSVVPMGKRLAIFYDGQDADPIPPGFKNHMNRDIGLAWLNLPLAIPTKNP